MKLPLGDFLLSVKIQKSKTNVFCSWLFLDYFPINYLFLKNIFEQKFLKHIESALNKGSKLIAPKILVLHSAPNKGYNLMSLKILVQNV